jgi:16S rRNA (adenine1518-N6/adenine1519-N6)-dimethyltransferase
LDALPPLRDVIARHDLRADKRLGQNFLLDLNITAKIARAAGPLGEATLFEIGPGPGGLTRSLLNAGAKKLIAVEYDPRAVAALQELAAADGRLTVLRADALETDLLTLAPAGPRVIVANLPYNIATPLLLGWLRQVRQSPDAFAAMTLMFQREVADRLTALPGNKIYGRLSVMAQWLCAVDRLFDLPPSVFVPPPKVTSSVVRFVPRVLSPGQPSFRAMETTVADAFNQRRKMLRSALKSFPGLIEKAGIDGALRAEQLAVADFVRLAGLHGS